MARTLTSTLIVIMLGAWPGIGQDAIRKSDSVPLYRVTVVERNVDAVNYQYRSGPTEIDFRGTVLLPDAKGRATVESQRGRTQIDAKFDHMVAPTRFGREYLTYVLWAISPDGAPHNLGEIVANSSDHAHSAVTTDLQVFGLIITAEPYSTVRQPSNVVVLENKVRPDTLGSTQPIQAKVELLPRGQYTYNVENSLETGVNNAPKVSMSEYEGLLELYQAQNALGIARAAHAEQYAPNTFAKAQQAYEDAQRLHASKGDSKLVVQNARAAAEMAEDARTIAERRSQDEQMAKAQAAVTAAQQAKAQAEAEAQQARADAETARAQAQAERQAREQAEATAAQVGQRVTQAHTDRVAAVTPAETAPPVKQQQRDQRIRLMEALNGVMETRDTPRGLVVTVTDDRFSSVALRADAAAQVSRLAAVLASQPGLHISVEGYSDSPQGRPTSDERAAAVRAALTSGGAPAQQITSEGLGDSRPIVSNDSEQGRAENRRVEIVIAGDAIGTVPFWDRTYTIAPQ